MYNSPGKVIEFKGDSDGHWIAAVLNVEGTPLILLNVYGYNSESKNNILLSQISDTIREFKSKYPTDNILTGRDFNCVRGEWLDRLPTRYVDHE